MNMVRVRMGVDGGIKAVRAGVNHLGAEIRSRINHNRCAITGWVKSLNQKRGTTTPILRIVGIAAPPIAIDARHAGRRTAAQNRDTLAISGGYHALALSDGRGI